MRATLLHGAGDIRVSTVPDPSLRDPRDALVRVTHSCICGSDLWPYRSAPEAAEGRRIGHEFLGVVEEVGADVTKFAPGDQVIAPFMYSDGTCTHCRNGWPTSCISGGNWGGTTPSGGWSTAARASTCAFRWPTGRWWRCPRTPIPGSPRRCWRCPT